MTYKDIRVMFRGMNIPFSNLMQKLLHKVDLDITKINKDLDDKVNKEDIDIDSIVEQSIPSVIEQAIPKVAEEIVPTLDDRYVQFDKKYSKLTAGFAENLISDDVSTKEEFTFRPTAGEDRNVVNTTYYNGERNGVARIEKIKGNSVVWNKPIKNKVDTTNTEGDGWYNRGGDRVSVTFDGDLITQVTTTSASTTQLSQNIGLTQYHKYYILWEWDYPEEVFTLETENEIRFRALSDRNGTQGSFIKSTTKAKGKYETIWEQTSSNYPFISLALRFYKNFLSAQSWTIKNRIRVCDLTKMFTAGNEPTTIEEFWQRLPEGIDISEYSEGIIIDSNHSGIKTVGFNAFNSTYAKVCAGCPYYLGGNYISLGFTTEEGGAIESIAIPTSTENVGTTPSDRLYTPNQNGYIYANGDKININLSWHTEYGYLNGTYQPYKPFIRDLSWIKKYFPNGMRSAGSVNDEIRFNPTTQKWEAVQNVGVTTMGDMMWSKDGNTFLSTTLQNTAKPSQANNVKGDLLCIPYVSDTFNNVFHIQTNKIIGISQSSGTIRVYDADYSDADSFKANNYNVQLYYELATPIITEIEEDINMDFDVYDYGTEEVITSENLHSAPLKADIVYSLDAFYTLKNVPDILKDIKLLKSELENLKNTNTNNIEE